MTSSFGTPTPASSVIAVRIGPPPTAELKKSRGAGSLTQAMAALGIEAQQPSLAGTCITWGAQ
jgi:hypothetical protein